MKKIKNKDISDLTNLNKHNTVKNSNFLSLFKQKFSHKRKITKEIIQLLAKKHVNQLFLYTNVKNLIGQIEYGIFPTNEIINKTEQEHIIWAYSEKNDYIELELDNSTRHFFWKWVLENNIEINDIAIVGLDIDKLFNYTNKDWSFNLDNNRIKIYEKIVPQCISWMLVKDNFVYDYLKTYIESTNLPIKLFQSESGKIINNNIIEKDFLNEDTASS